jgi:sec-independent protein translocase protein TatA
MMGLSLSHVLILAVVVVLLLGGGRFSNLMGDVAKGIKSFKKGMSEEDEPARRIASEQPLDARPIPPPPPADPAASVPPVATPDPDRHA